MFHTFPRIHSVRFLIITVALACLASWATFLTSSHSQNAKRNLSRKPSASTEVGAEPLRTLSPSPIVAPSPTWNQLTPTGGAPDNRAYHSSVYDTTNNRMTIFAGGTGQFCSGAPPLKNDVWTLTNADGSGGTPSWNQLFPTGTPPAPRGGQASVYDPATNRMIVYGGDLSIGNCFSAVNDVWVLTNANGLGGTPAWTQLAPSGGPPNIRQQPRAVYHSATNRLIVYSGNANGCSPFNAGEVWVLSNANGLGGAPAWTQLAPTGTAPAPRVGNTLEYDAVNNRLIVFAGSASPGGSMQNDTWVLSNADGLGGTPNWTQLLPSGPLPAVRSNHTAVYNLAVNQMVVFGGQDPVGNRFNDVWVLSNANGLGGAPTWTQVTTTGGPPNTRSDHTAVYNPTSNRMTVYAGWDSSCFTRGDLWTLADVTTACVTGDSWASKTPMLTARNGLSLGESNGTIYAAGGWNGSHLQTLEAYNTNTDSWTTKNPMLGPQSHAASGVINGRLYLAGGTNCCVEINTFTIYDTATDSWSFGPNMPTVRQRGVGGVINGKFYVAGGSNTQNQPGILPLATLEVYDPGTSLWSSLTPMPTARSNATGSVINGIFYVVGGHTDASATVITTTMEAYDPVTNTWTTKAPMPVQRQNGAAAVVNGLLYVIGGLDSSNNFTSTVQIYNPTTNSWTVGPSMPTARAYFRAATVGGTVYAIGGEGAAGRLGTNESLTPCPIDLTPTPTPTPTPQADLSITKTASPSGNVASGSQITYTITASNAGASAAASVSVNDSIPAGTTFASFTTSQGTCTAPPAGASAPPLSCSLGAISSGGSATVTLRLNVTALPGATITNTANVSSPTFDPNTSNNSASANNSVAGCDLVVTNTNDAGAHSLRQAILCANANTGPDTISFNIPFSDPGFGVSVFTIRPLSPLPILSDSGTTIDGATQTTFSGNTNPAGPEVVLNGSLTGFSAPFGGGLNITSSGNHIHSLVINGFNVTGIVILGAGATGNRVTGCYIGTDATGMAANANTFDGIAITQLASNNVIGGTTPQERNVISGNARHGVLLFGNGLNVFNNVIEGNFIGTNASGQAALGNAKGVALVAANSNTIGGTAPGAGNLISGNTEEGIHSNSSSNQTIQGNYIGTNATGTSAIRNGFSGINIFTGGAPSANNLIGGSAPGAGNLISGNNGAGIAIGGLGSDSNVIQGNLIGTDVSGSSPLANTATGISLGGAANVIGGTAAGARNVISGNGSNGINITGPTATGNQVQGNFIGTNAAGNAPVPNGGTGVSIGSSGNTIGGTTAAARNLISGNIKQGIRILTTDATLNVVQGNYVGTNATGTTALGNGGNGIVMNLGASANQIGGAAPGAGNLVSGNVGSGIYCLGVGTSNNTIQGNFCGTNASGTTAIPNQVDGIRFDSGSTDNLVGGTTFGARNVISGNLAHGIHIDDFPAEDNGPHLGTARITVQGNLIGTDASGTGPIGNHLPGVIIFGGASDNLIGGTDPGAGNVIAFTLGTVDDGQGGSLPAAGAGISVANDNSTVGDSSGGSSVRNRISQNSIFSNAGLGINLSNFANGLNATQGPIANDSCDGDTGPNNFQNFPVLTAVSSSNGSTSIHGTLNSAPNTTFTLQFFSNESCDASGFGEGQTFIGSTTITTDANCQANFMFISTLALSGQFITATATDPNGNTSEFSACGFVNADISINKTASPNPVVTGSDLTYTVSVNYSGPAPAANVTVTDNLPSQTTFKSITAPAGWSCTTPAIGSNGTVSCTKTTMAPSESPATFTIVTTVDCSVGDGVVISDTATASSSTTDSNETNNSSAANVTASNPPPTITCPGNITITTSLGSDSAAVSYPPPTASDNCGVPIVSCSQPSGSSFPIGTTTVNCTATDSSNNASSCTFSVTLLTPQGATQQLGNAVNSLVSLGTLSQGNGNALTAKLRAAINSMNGGDITGACNQLGAFINQTRAYMKSGKLTQAQGQALIDSANAVKGVLGC